MEIVHPQWDENSRGKYKCGRCGQPKNGHICEYGNESTTSETSSNVEKESNPWRGSSGFGFATILNRQDENRPGIQTSFSLPPLQQIGNQPNSNGLSNGSVEFKGNSQRFSSIPHATIAPRPQVPASTPIISSIKRSKEKKNIGTPVKNFSLQSRPSQEEAPFPEASDNSSTKVLRDGRWTADEHERFLVGFRIHGHKWKQVQQVVKTRTVTQVRTHAQKYLLKLAKANGEGNNPTSVPSSSPVSFPEHRERPVPSTAPSDMTYQWQGNGQPQTATPNQVYNTEGLSVVIKKNNITNGPAKAPHSWPGARDSKIEEAASTLCSLMGLRVKTASIDNPQFGSISLSGDITNNGIADDGLRRKQYLCRKCKVPKKGHLCKYSEDEEKQIGLEKKRLADIQSSESVKKTKYESMDEHSASVKSKNDNEDTISPKETSPKTKTQSPSNDIQKDETKTQSPSNDIQKDESILVERPMIEEVNKDQAKSSSPPIKEERDDSEKKSTTRLSVSSSSPSKITLKTNGSVDLAHRTSDSYQSPVVKTVSSYGSHQVTPSSQPIYYSDETDSPAADSFTAESVDHGKDTKVSPDESHPGFNSCTEESTESESIRKSSMSSPCSSDTENAAPLKSLENLQNERGSSGLKSKRTKSLRKEKLLKENSSPINNTGELLSRRVMRMFETDSWGCGRVDQVENDKIFIIYDKNANHSIPVESEWLTNSEAEVVVVVSTGEVVSAKIKGQPYWPALKYVPLREVEFKKVFLEFFGDHTVSWVRPNQCKSFESSSFPSSNKELQAAVLEAQEVLDNFKPSKKRRRSSRRL